MKKLLILTWAVSAPFAAWPDTVRTMTDGTTPPSIAPGAPAGSYPLSGFESINLFNGNLSVGLPLLHIGGRGTAGYDITLRNDNNWRFEAVSFYLLNGQTRSGSSCSNASGCGPFLEYVPIPAWWAPYEVGYSPGLLFGRIGKSGSRAPNCPDNPHSRLIRLTFIDPSGAEHELRDTTAAGDDSLSGKPHEPVETQPIDCSSLTVKDRGKIFKSFDGSSMTFISDFTITDEGTTGGPPSPPEPNGNDISQIAYPTGYLMLKDGTRYRITQSRVDWIRDRNGNTSQYTYDALSRVVEIRDAMHRKVSIAYGAASDVLNFRGYNGTLRSITVNYASMSAGGTLGCTPNTDVVNTSATPTLKSSWDLFPHPYTIENPNCFFRRVIKNVVLPNTQAYSFTYNEYGEITKVSLPTGGAYVYTRSRNVAGGDVPVIQQFVTEKKALDSGGTVISRQTFSGFDSHPAQGSETVTELTTTVTNYDGDETTILSRQKHKFYFNMKLSDATPVSYSGLNHGKEFKTEFYDAGGTTLLRSVLHSFANRTQLAWWTSVIGQYYEPTNDPRITRTETTLTGVPSKTTTQTFAYDQFNNLTETKELGFGSTELRKTTTNYLTTNADNQNKDYTALDANPANVIHIRNLPTRQSIYEGACEMGRSEYQYDSSTVDSVGGTITGRLNLVDPAAFPSDPFPSTVKSRGNLTKTVRFVRYDTSDPCIPTTASAEDLANISTRLEYDMLGNVVRSYDGNGNVTSFDFADNWLPSSPTPDLPANHKTYAVLKSVTNALSHITTMENDYSLGKARKITDANDQSTSIVYMDSLDRPTLVSRPGGGSTGFVYDDPGGKVSVTTTPYQRTEQFYDGLGRTCESRAYVTGSSFIRTMVKHDGLNRTAKTFNPYETTSAPTRCAEAAAGTASTTSTFDGVDRVTAVTHADGRVTSNVYIAGAANEVTTTDPAGLSRKSVMDGLGRLQEVVENPSGGTDALSTVYAYDALDNLTGVTQGTQARTFTYDSVGRLRRAVNPEAALDYGYDKAGNLTSRSDGRVSVTIIPDALNRVMSRTYGTGLAVGYCYDDGSLCGGAAVPNGKGRLIRVITTKGGTAVSTNRYGSFDGMGRVTSSQQTTNNTDYVFANYSYDLAGALTSITYPSGRVVSSGYDEAGRPAGVVSGTKTYANNVEYWPHGAMKKMTLGNGLVEQASYNNRLQMRSMQLGVSGGSTAAWKAEYCWDVTESGCAGNAVTGNNGNLQAQTITAPGSFGATQKYSYDALSRLLKAQEASVWTQDYLYDRWGNRALKTGSNEPNGSCGPKSDGPSALPFSGSTNQWTGGGVGYDASGNWQTGCGQTYAFDGENRVEEVNSGAVTYSYDGEGRRVKKVEGAGTPAEALTVWVYDGLGNLAAEYRSGAASPCATCYLTADHLGSTRVVTGDGTATGDGTNLVIARHDYLPFGQEIPAGWGGRTVAMKYGAADEVRQRFTGKERDAETGLDYFGARYMSAAQGRFTSPDPVFMTRQRVGDPQQWNLYAYVRNNPLMFVDPDGKELRLAVRNYSKYSAETVQRAAAMAASRFRAAGVQNVSVDFRQGPPTAMENVRYFFTGVRAFVAGSERSHLSEVRPSTRGEGITNTDIKQGESGRNFGGSSAIDASHVEAKTSGVDAAVLGLANLMTHEIAHDVFIPHNETNVNDPMFRDARPEFLSNPQVQFSPAQAAALRKRFNTKEEQEAWERQQSPGAQK